MKHLRIALICLFLACSAKSYAFGANSAQLLDDEFKFNQDRMILSPIGIFVASTFDDQDHITAYTYKGELLWDLPFHAKIISWQLAGDKLIVFSKGRKGNRTYVTSIDKFSGNLYWQRP